MPDQRLFLTVLGGLGLVFWWRVSKRVQARRYGQDIEAKHSAYAIHDLAQQGFSVEVGRMTRIGDIDLIVRRGGRSATVEIKSFWYWRSRFRDIGRQRKARRQALSQRRLVRADLAVIWLPKARPTLMTRLLNALLPERNPMVVMGPSSRLVSTLNEQLSTR